MTLEEKVDMLRRTMDGAEDDTGILEVYLKLAEQAVLNRMYPFRENFEGMEVPDKYVMAQLTIANYLLNKRGAEGQIQHIENGIHRNYGSSGIPEAMLQEIVPFCQAMR